MTLTPLADTQGSFFLGNVKPESKSRCLLKNHFLTDMIELQFFKKNGGLLNNSPIVRGARPESVSPNREEVQSDQGQNSMYYPA